MIVAERQIRLWWDETPVDLFFDYVPVHADAARHGRTVPFAGTRIPVLGPVELAAFKVMYDRTRDWADIEAMVAAETVDLDAVRATLAPMLAFEDPRFARLDEAVLRGARASSSRATGTRRSSARPIRRSGRSSGCCTSRRRPLAPALRCTGAIRTSPRSTSPTTERS